FGVVLASIAQKFGYLTSVTNPLVLVVAQPIVGVPVFSGAGFRAATVAIVLPIGIWFLLRNARRSSAVASESASVPRLSFRHLALLLILAGAVVLMVVGVQQLGWRTQALSAMYLGIAIVLAVVAGRGSRVAVQ